MGFKVGQKVIYPNHGIGTIEQIEQKQIGATSLPFYTLRLASTNSVVLVPVANAREVGLRSPISSGECEMLFRHLHLCFAPPFYLGDAPLTPTTHYLKPAIFDQSGDEREDPDARDQRRPAAAGTPVDLAPERVDGRLLADVRGGPPRSRCHAMRLRRLR